MIKDLQEKIIKLKKEKDCVILAHSYQSTDILDIADYTGDSFKLSVVAKELQSNTVIMCGVKFMAETIKILSPQKKVILPVYNATCPMAESITPQDIIQFKKKNPSFKVVAYVNTTAEVKAECDVCVTSSSALKIVRSIKEKDIFFLPDRNLGSFVKKEVPEKNIVLWDGCCPVHDSVTEQECIDIKREYPNAKFLMHPELPQSILKYADLIGSTSEIINYALNNNNIDCVIGTEANITNFLKIKNPNNRYIQLSKSLMCNDMRLTSLADVYNSMIDGKEITLDSDIIKKARKPIDEMIRLGG